MKTCAVIPFYNECTTIKQVIDETLRYVDSVIAVDDGSTDDSVSKISKNNNVIVLSWQDNLGKGFALRKGFEKAIELNFNLVITIDADLQHSTGSIPELISCTKNFDIVIGNRLNNMTGMPLQRRISNRLTSILLSIKTGTKIIDSQCGFRAYKIDALKNVNTRSHGYEAESEIIVMAARAKYNIGFIEVPTIYANEKSKMNPFKAVLGFVKILFY